jgi:hypothetical protein
MLFLRVSTTVSNCVVFTMSWRPRLFVTGRLRVDHPDLADRVRADFIESVPKKTPLLNIPIKLCLVRYPVWAKAAMAATVTTIFFNSLWGGGSCSSTLS